MNKKIISTSLKILFSVLPLFIFFFISGGFSNSSVNTSPPSYYTTPNNPDKFLFGAFQTNFDQGYNYSNYDAIGLNGWHAYCDDDIGDIPGQPLRHSPQTHLLSCEDRVFTDVTNSNWINGLKALIAGVNSHNQSKLLWDRPKIDWLISGRSSVYRCNQNHIEQGLWFYAFNDHQVGEDYPDNVYLNGAWVWHATNPQQYPNGGFLVKRLKANAEQSRQEGYQGDIHCTWYVKPRIRAEKNFINNSANANVPICTLYVKDQNGNDKITPLVILAEHFYDYANPYSYNGQYMSEFYFCGCQECFLTALSERISDSHYKKGGRLGLYKTVTPFFIKRRFLLYAVSGPSPRQSFGPNLTQKPKSLTQSKLIHFDFIVY